MPFQSRSQMRNCYALRARGRAGSWDCDKWLDETPQPQCLPEHKGGQRKCRPIRKGESVKGPVQTGAKGGKFFEVAGTKVYLPRGKRGAGKRRKAKS